MRTLCLVLLLLCGSVQAQQIIYVPQAVVAQPVVAVPVVAVPAQIVYVPRWPGPITRLFLGPYRPVLVPQPIVVAVPQEKNGK